MPRPTARFALLGLAVVLLVALCAWWLRPAAPTSNPALSKHSWSLAVAAAHAGTPGAARVLYQQLARSDLEPERRARLYAELPNYPSARALGFARADLAANHPLVRHAAIDAVAALVPNGQRGALLGPLLDDAAPDIRFHAARQLLALSPDDLGVYFGPLQAVLDDYVTTLEGMPDQAQAQTELAHIYRHDGDYAKATQAIERVLALTPGDLDAVVSLAEIQDAQNRPDTARQTLAEALKKQPDSAFLQHELGLWLLHHGQEEYALLALTRAVELAPDDSTVRLDLAVALHTLEQLQAAQQQLDELLRRDPANRKARLLLISYWKESGQLQNVQVLLAELEQQNADDPALQP